MAYTFVPCIPISRSWAEALPGWREMRAVRERRTFIANGSAYFSRPGPRLVDTLEMIAAALHPKECAYPDRGMAAVY